ncbi:hypothetical protein [Streptomyces sp. RFCAC02]|uniref:hypothetical protein n=1 Tax=Streptomyces sp. RFCAC02 TaxID=2499143 RepID=UPI00101EB054|nr:hypothetical protein [Streptomyces sp. RFCAC02]
MAHNQQQPYGSQDSDPAGSTQMFKAFVDGGGTPQAGPAATPAQSSGSKTGLIIGVVVAIVVIAVVAFLALG